MACLWSPHADLSSVWKGDVSHAATFPLILDGSLQVQDAHVKKRKENVHYSLIKDYTGKITQPENVRCSQLPYVNPKGVWKQLHFCPSHLNNLLSFWPGIVVVLCFCWALEKTAKHLTHLLTLHVIKHCLFTLVAQNRRPILLSITWSFSSVAPLTSFC